MTKEQYDAECRSAGLLHTPDGVRDVYGGECGRKLWVQRRISDVLRLYGYQDIQTPTFEFFDIFSKERGTIASNEMYKFFDREGNTLALRPDITPSIARCVAKYFKDEAMPIRLCYTGSTFINNGSHQGKLNEMTQVGAELMNDGSADGDAEMVAMTVRCLQAAGLEEFQVEVGHAGFFNALMEEGRFDWEEAMELKVLMESKNLFGVEEMISRKDLGEDLRELIRKLPELFGTWDNIGYARERVRSGKALEALDRLEKLHEIIEEYGAGEYVTLDLGMLSRYDYYSGIILNAYAYGSGDAIAQGGRYDHLIGQFGKDAPAVGIAFLVDQLMGALSTQKKECGDEGAGFLIVFGEAERRQAIQLARSLREDGKEAKLFFEERKRPLEEYRAYGKRMGIRRILLFEDPAHLSEFFAEDEIEITTEIGRMTKAGETAL